MLNVSSTTAVSWPTPVSTAVAPVSPVAAVQPVQAGGNDGKAQTGFGREGRSATPQQAVAGRAAPEGRAATTEDAAAATQPASRSAAGVPAVPQDVAAQRQAQQEAAQVAEQRQAKDKKAVEHLQNVLSRMWEASAAVVDRALGIEPAKGSEVPGNQSDTAPDLSAVTASMIPRKPLAAERADRSAMEQLPWPVMPQGAEGDEALQLDVVGDGVGPETVAEVVAYDEHGNGSTAPVETGTIISERV